MDIPQGAIPAEQFQAAPQASSSEVPPGAIPAEEFQTHEEKYGTGEQQIKAGLEGAAQGVLGPLAPLAETKLFGVKPEDIRGRAEANPVTSGVGEAAGFVGGAFLPFGEAALLGKVGEGVKAISGIGEATQLARVGSAAAQQAAEMAVLQSGNEISKQILQDPDTSAQQAIANIGLASALGGAGGAFVTGAISPLWKATVGPKVEGFLTSLSSHINGGEAVLPEMMQKSVEQLGVEPHPIMQAALSGDPKALEMARTLYRSENPEFMASLRDLQTKTSESVANSLGVPLEEAAHFSNKAQGDMLSDMAKNHIEKDYGPIAEALNKRDAEAAKIMVPDQERLDFANKIMEKAITEGTDSPYYKVYENYAQRLLAKDDIHGIDKLRTELFNNTKSGANMNEKNAWNNIRNMLGDFREGQITKQAGALGKEGKQLGSELLNEHAQTNRTYAEYAKKLDKLSDFLGIGDFRGTGNLKSKLDGLTSEQLVKKFSTKGDVEGAEFLNKNFPEIAEQVRQHEAKQFLNPVVREHNGEYVLDTKGLNKRVDNLMKGSPEYAKYVLPEQALNNIKAAKVVNDNISNITNIKDSGTPAGLMKLFSHLGAGAGGAIGWMAGSNPISGAVAGQVAKLLTIDAPQAIKLAMLKHMAADVPVKAEGFKAIVDMMHNTIKGESYLNKATAGIFKSGAAGTIYIPKAADLEKLDKLIAKTDQDPHALDKKFIENGAVGHYMPEHQQAMANTTKQAVQYLKTLKPQPTQLSPLDKPLPPSDIAEARYKRALTIAENPLVITKHIKDGTLQPSDIADLKQIYPAMYNKMAQKINTEMVNTHHEGNVPYNTRLSMSLFLAQPLDSTMTPASIMAAQPLPKQPPPEQPQGGGKGKGAAAKLGKSNKSYQTQTQSAESDRGSRD